MTLKEITNVLLAILTVFLILLFLRVPTFSILMWLSLLWILLVVLKDDVEETEEERR